MERMQAGATTLLNDTPSRDYSLKLRRFNEFAEPEIRRAMATLGLVPGMRVLDVGCGSGEALRWFHESVKSAGLVAGIDVAAAHTAAARVASPSDVLVAQADLLHPPFPNALFDLIWCVNTIGHLRRPLEGLAVLRSLLNSGGRIALGQSSFMPDMLFAWDARFERVITEAVRQFYRDRYDISEHHVAHVRGLFGMLKRAGLRDVTAQTFIIERTFPLNPTDEGYLIDVVFRQARPERLKPYLSDEDFGQLTQLFDPENPAFALRRDDFHFLQTFSLVVGGV
jgi:SAM-dependent methyltransferase